jgi:predicted porin
MKGVDRCRRPTGRERSEGNPSSVAVLAAASRVRVPSGGPAQGATDLNLGPMRITTTGIHPFEEGRSMLIRNKAKPVLAALSAMAMLLAGVGYASAALADDKALADQVRILMQRVEELTKEVQTLKKQPAQAPAPAAAPAVAAAPAEPKFDSFMKGFYGTLDVSLDDTTKGMNGFVAYHLLSDGSGLDYTNPKAGGAGPVGRVGYMPALSTNKSQLGYRGSHEIAKSGVNFIYQIETALAITASPGLRTSQYQQSNVVSGAIGLGDTFIGLSGKDWGRVKFGTFYSPYKKSTDRLNPFSGMLGDYAVIMGNSGGDNRVEFGTRLDHSLAYESPKWNGFSFDVLFSPGQNRTYNNVVQSSGSPDCNGGNMPGSGNLLLNCDDGGFDNAFSVDVQYEYQDLYLTAAYEIHKNVNRNSDGIGSNHPLYGPFTGGVPPLLPDGVTPNPEYVCNGALLDCATYEALVAEYPSYINYTSPPYLNDIGDEKAFKIGAQYKFPIGLTVSAMWEKLKRDLPAELEFQNERTRDNATWLALSQDVGANDNLSVGWAHAGKTPGDPGGQHNYDPSKPDNSANMFTAAWKHKLDKQLYWYADWAATINKANAHYDIGAGGRGLTTDCHDGTHAISIDYSSNGNTTWGGCREQGFSTGLNFKF